MSGDWKRQTMLAAMRKEPGLEDADEQKLLAAIAEARQRWKTGPAALRAVTLNHGGVVTRLREAVAKMRRGAQMPETLQTAALVWQADGRLYRTMKTLAADNDIVLLQELHEMEPELQERLKALLTTGEFASWAVEMSPAAAGDPYAGVMTWYNTETVLLEARGETAEGRRVYSREEVPGRLQTVEVRARADGTKLTLANVYVVPRSGAPSGSALAALTAVREGLQRVADAARAAGAELAIAGDLQAQTARALSASRKSGNEYDAWLELFTMTNLLVSAGAVEPTYVTGDGGTTTAIDH